LTDLFQKLKGARLWGTQCSMSFNDGTVTDLIHSNLQAFVYIEL